MSLVAAAQRAASLMRSRSLRVVTAESCTGGLIAAALARVPGISEFLCGGLVVYRNATKTAYLNVPKKRIAAAGPESAEVCEAMARGALDKTPEADVSVAITGHLGPGAPADLDGLIYVGVARRGRRASSRHEVHVCRSRLPSAPRASRQKQAAETALEMLSDMLSLPASGEWPRDIELREREWTELVFGEVDAVCVGGRDVEGDDRPPVPLIYPGAFNPLHDGHRQLARWAAELRDGEVEFEISIANVDKPPIDFRDAIDRLRSFDPQVAVWLTRAATFLEKSAIFPGATFIVGADTIERIGASRYYSGGDDGLLAALETIGQRGCRFLVFGRQIGKRYVTLDDLSLPKPLARLCEAAPADKRLDVASRDIRKRRRGV